MGKLNAYLFTSLNGYFESPKGDISWHTHADEQDAYAEDSLKPGNMLLFGRITYQMMVSYWASPAAAQNDPKIAEGMNKAQKIVFSRTLERVDWNNTRLLKENIFDEIQRIKKTGEQDLTILGSGSIVTQFADHGLLDSLQIMIDPVALGSGTPILLGLKQKLNLKLTHSHVFNNGVVLLNYLTT